MDADTRQSIIQNHVKFALAMYGFDKRKYDIWETSTQIKIKVDWITFEQERFVGYLAQRLEMYGYEVDVVKDGKRVVIDDKEIEDED